MKFRTLGLVFSLTSASLLAQPAAATAARGPAPFKQLRYDETYLELKDAAQHKDPLDALRFLPLAAAKNSYLTLGGEARLRYEYFNHASWGRGPQDENGYLLQRYMLHANAHLSSAWRVFVQLKSGFIADRAGGPRPAIDEDVLDLGQAFVDFHSIDSNTADLTVRAGRQELSYGSARLVSFRETPNVRLSFDAAKVILKWHGWQTDIFDARPVRTDPGIFDDRGDPTQRVWGVFSSGPFPALKNSVLDLYYFGLDRENFRTAKATGDMRLHSFGFRLAKRTGAADFELEAVEQVGQLGNRALRAWYVTTYAGMALRGLPYAARAGLELSVASGDDGPQKTELGTFNSLYLKGPRYGDPFLIAPANSIGIHPQLDITWNARWLSTIDWEYFLRESTHDGVYAPPGILIQSGASSTARQVGHQLSHVLEFRANRSFTATFRYGHFFAGDFLKAIKPARDVDYSSVTLRYRF